MRRAGELFGMSLVATFFGTSAAGRWGRPAAWGA
jgi:hypothetical protein